MAVDMTGWVEIGKEFLVKLADKIGRKQIIAITTIISLAWLVNKQADLTVTEPALARLGLILIAVVGIAGILAQSFLDYTRPRNKKEAPPG